MYGVDSNDRMTVLAADGAMQSVVVFDGAGPRSGAASSMLLAQGLREHLADVAAAQMWVAVAHPVDSASLGEMLYQLRAAGCAVHGFVERAALLAAWLQLPGSCVLLDLTRHGLVISQVFHDGVAVSLRRTVRLPGGQAALHDAWVNLAAATLVEQTRFDPLHDQRQEAQLRERLPVLATEAQRTGQGHCMIEAGANALPLTLTRDQLASAAGDWLQPLAAALQSLSAAMDDSALLVPQSLLQIPGVSAALATARFARVFSLDENAVARAASLLPQVIMASSGGVQYLLRVPLFNAPGDALAIAPLQLRDGSGTPATHVIYNGRVLPIPAAGLVVGSNPGEANGLRLPDGVAGLSRRHCTLRYDGIRAQIVDHSSFGSFVDGARVRGRALLVAGNVLRLGEPGIDLPLVAMAVPDASPH